MACEHKRLKCTNNVFYCMDCGAVLPPDVLQRKPERQEENQAPRRKRKAKGADGNENH
jgi:hypothetical protein